MINFRSWLGRNREPQPGDDPLKRYRYGQYCGPGPYLDKGCKNLRTGEQLPAPVNTTDAQCRVHDIEYCKCGVGSSAGLPGMGTRCSLEADRALVKSLIDKVKNKEITNPKELVAAKLITLYFRINGSLQGFKFG